jgi:hypothetical protein
MAHEPTTDSGTVEDPMETIIDQDHKRNPGWFLIASYIVISIFCVYYLVSNWGWKSDYEIQQQELRAKVERVARPS